MKRVIKPLWGWYDVLYEEPGLKIKNFLSNLVKNYPIKDILKDQNTGLSWKVV